MLATLLRVFAAKVPILRNPFERLVMFFLHLALHYGTAAFALCL
tara:strand:- start:62 stop:193 length:132 start_codon:yes stop_codon:yes gene_type:complete